MCPMQCSVFFYSNRGIKAHLTTFSFVVHLSIMIAHLFCSYAVADCGLYMLSSQWILIITTYILWQDSTWRWNDWNTKYDFSVLDKWDRYMRTFSSILFSYTFSNKTSYASCDLVFNIKQVGKPEAGELQV